MRGKAMTQTRLDLPWNFPADWDVPTFMDGEVPALAMQEGERIVGIAKVAFQCGAHKTLDLQRIKTGIACYRLGWLFETNRQAILEALRRERTRKRDGEF